MDTQKHTPSSPIASSNGLALGSLIMSLLAILSSIAVVGAILGFAGVILGVLHLQKSDDSRTMAKWGVGLSTLSIILSTVLFTWYLYLINGYFYTDDFEDDSLSEWQGVLAPEFEVTTIKGEHIKLSDLKGKRVIVDIWATWCGPCLMEIPHFNTLSEELSDDDLVIIGICEEEADVLKNFMKNTEINYRVTEEQHDLPAPYSSISAYPTTFFIDRNGVIQHISVGYEDLDTLREYATAPDFEGEPIAAPLVPESELPNHDPLLYSHSQWSIKIDGVSSLTYGDWDQDNTVELLVADMSRNIHIIDTNGETKDILKLPSLFETIQFSPNGPDGPRLLAYSEWDNSITVFDTTGKELWQYMYTTAFDWLFSENTAINGARWGDLDGDGIDEVIIGFNGKGGLHAISHEGQRVWRNRSLDSVFDQKIVSANGSGTATIAVTDMGDPIKLFDGTGEKTLSVLPFSMYYINIDAQAIDAEGTIQLLGHGNDEHIIAFDTQGEVQWSTSSDGEWRTTTFACGDIDQDGIKDWAFIDGTGDLIIANSQGEKLSSVSSMLNIDSFLILPLNEGGGQLITTNGKAISAYSFSEESTTGAIQ